MRSEELPIFLETYKFVLELLPMIEKLPKLYKYTIGTKLIDESVKLFSDIQLANSTLYKDGKKTYLIGFISTFSIVKVLIRILVDRKSITFKQHALLLPYLDSIGKQATAWKKSIKPRAES